MRIRIENYDHFYDLRTRVQFERVLDRRTGLHVGIAEVSPEVGAQFLARRGFREVTDETYLAMTSALKRAEPKRAEPAAPLTGDPFGDALAAQAANDLAAWKAEKEGVRTLTSKGRGEKSAAGRGEKSAAGKGKSDKNVLMDAPPPPPK
jgi:hypothetical protein